LQGSKATPRRLVRQVLRTFCVHSQHISTGLSPFRKGSTNR
jgi:hypothetical protein